MEMSVEVLDVASEHLQAKIHASLKASMEIERAQNKSHDITRSGPEGSIVSAQASPIILG